MVLHAPSCARNMPAYDCCAVSSLRFPLVLLATMAAEVGDRRLLPLSRPPHWVSGMKNTWSTQGQIGTASSRAKLETIPMVVKPLALASS